MAMTDYLEPNEPWLLQTLAVIANLPGAHLGTENVRALEVYLLGCMRAREDLGAPHFAPEEADLLSEFGRWLAAKFQIDKELGWAGYIGEIDPSDRNVRTFRLLVEFLASRGMRLPEPRRPRPGGLGSLET